MKIKKKEKMEIIEKNLNDLKIIEWISVIMNLIILLRLESSNICITIRLERLNRFKKRRKREEIIIERKQLIRN